MIEITHVGRLPCDGASTRCSLLEIMADRAMQQTSIGSFTPGRYAHGNDYGILLDIAMDRILAARGGDRLAARSSCDFDTYVGHGKPDPDAASNELGALTGGADRAACRR